MFATICNTLNCTDYEASLSIITSVSRDQGTLSKLKNDLEVENNITPKLKEDNATLEADKARHLCHSGNLEFKFFDQGETFQEEIKNLKNDLEKEK